MAMRRLVALVAVAVLLSALTACSTGERVDLGGESSADNLIAAIAGEPDQLDPHKTSAYFSFEVLENVFDTLVEPDANLEMRPALAESWNVSADQLTWTFHLRRGVTFHDGSPFTADDVVYSYRRIIDEKLANVDKFSAVSDVTAPDPTTVVIRVKQPTPNLLTNLGGFKGMAIVSRSNVESGQIATHPIGTGPFAFSGQKSGDSITLKANPTYWGGPPEGFGRHVPVHLRTDHGAVGPAGRRDRLDRLDTAAARRAAEGRRLDQLGGHREQRLLVSRAQRGAQAVERRAGAASRRVRASTAKRSWRPRVTAPPRRISLRYRRATPGTPNTTSTATTSRRPRACCDEAGVVAAELDMLVTSEYPETVTAAQVIADNLAPLGITVNIRTVDFATWLDEQNTGNFDMLMMGWLGNIDPDDFYYAQHHTDGTSNAQKFSNPEVDRLLDAGRIETNREARGGLYNRGGHDHRRPGELHLPLQPVGDPGVDHRPHRLRVAS